MWRHTAIALGCPFMKLRGQGRGRRAERERRGERERGEDRGGARRENVLPNNKVVLSESEIINNA